MEMIIIIVIIMVVMMVVGGGLNPVMVQQGQLDMQYLAANQWNCEQVVWTSAPTVHDSLFEGTLEMNCRVTALDGRGISELRQWLIDELPRNAYQLHTEPSMELFEGMPGLAFDVTVRANADKEDHDIRGLTHIVSDGFQQVRSVFESTEMSRSAAKYLKGIRTEVNVRSTGDPHWYRVNFVNASVVKKPFGISNGTFRNKLVEKIEKDFKAKSETFVTGIANHI